MTSRLYWVWADMRGRCSNAKHKAFANYGGRGITVSERWADFAAFAADMGERPDGGMLDRTDNDGPYSAENCRWATRTEQNSNRRNCIYVSHGEQIVTLREYCRREGITYRPMVKRIQNLGWPVALALSTPIGVKPHFFRKEAA